MGSRILPIRNAERERHDGSGQEMIWEKGSETMEKSYEKVIEYVKKGIGSGEIQAGEKLLPEQPQLCKRRTPDPGEHGSPGEPAGSRELCLRKF